LVIQARI